MTHRFVVAFLALVEISVVGAAEHPTITAKDWELVRSVSNPYGGTEDFVLIPEEKKNDFDYYATVAREICGARKQCAVGFWTDQSHIPSSSNIAVRDLWEQTASYEVHPNYTEPHLRLACWLYPNKVAGEKERCFYMPGRKYFQDERK